MWFILSLIYQNSGLHKQLRSRPVSLPLFLSFSLFHSLRQSVPTAAYLRCDFSLCLIATVELCCYIWRSNIFFPTTSPLANLALTPLEFAGAYFYVTNALSLIAFISPKRLNKTTASTHLISVTPNRTLTTCNSVASHYLKRPYYCMLPCKIASFLTFSVRSYIFLHKKSHYLFFIALAPA